MDSIFLLQQEDRAALLQAIGSTIGCTYICIWSYVPPNNLLKSLDGWYNAETNQQPSSSAGTLPHRLFNLYRRSIYGIENGRVPGLAFMLGMPCLQLPQSELPTRASNEIQRQFYQEAEIKIAMFMGCRMGEIEIGSSISANINMQMDQIRNLFAEDFVRDFFSSGDPSTFERGQSSSTTPIFPHSSQDLTPFLNIPSPHFSVSGTTEGAPSHQATLPASSRLPPHQQAMQAHARTFNIRFPTPADDDAAMAKAMLAVLSSRHSLSSSHQTQQIETPQHPLTDGTGAFKPYTPAVNPLIGNRTSSNGQHRMKLVFALLRSMYSIGTEPWVQETRRRSSQLHHIINERRRREKMSEEFQELIILLPNVPKKERPSRVSVLSATREYLSALKAQLAELKEKNRELETQASAIDNQAGRIKTTDPQTERVGTAPTQGGRVETPDTQIERVVVQAMEASSSEERQIELRVSVLQHDRELLVLILQVLEQLKQMNDMTLASIEADIQLHHGDRWNRVIFRLKSKSGTWDDQSIKETINRAIFNEGQ